MKHWGKKNSGIFMNDDYHIDLEKYSLDKFKKDLSESELIPSRKILKEAIDKRFAVLRGNDIHNLQELTNVLKNPKKAREFALKSGLPEEYLLILRREVNSYSPNPVNLDKFPGINEETINKLKTAGIKNTAHLFKRIKTPDDRENLREEIDVSPSEILELAKLTDLVRIKWVGPIFARIFLESGTDNALKVSQADETPFYKKLVAINKEKGYTKGNFVENDVKLCIKVAGMLPKVIEF
jgi:hypothetical protein